jgi:NAD(P)-dependent dehydrogenase (short-subunit alcohol dehydrogenase family)
MSKVWLITGSSRGLGRALAENVLAKGERLIASARDPRTLYDLEQRYTEQMRAIPLDVTDEYESQKAVQSALDTFGRLDVLVNNAGYGNISSIEDTSLDDIRAQIDTNLFGVINVTKAVIPIMREQKSGHIIQISSIGGRLGPPGRGAYSAAKWGVEGFSEVLDKEVRPLGIKVTLVEPGAFRTEFAGISTSISVGGSEYRDTVGKMAQFQREHDGNQIGDPAKAAAAIFYLASLVDPPLRLLLGSDAVKGAELADVARMESDKKWRNLSLSTDFDTSNHPKSFEWE